MSYTPTEWTTGDVITAEKLNKIENGIVEAGGSGSSGGGGYGPLIVTVTIEEDEGYTIFTMDKTAGEIIAAMPLVYQRIDTQGKVGTVTRYLPIGNLLNPQVTVPGYLENNGTYSFIGYDPNLNTGVFFADTINDYPNAQSEAVQ